MGGGSLKIPDYKVYKVEDAPELMQLREKLARHGLKDPWIRNEVWRYTQHGMKGTTVTTRMFKSLLKGFPIAVVAVTGFVCLEKAYHTIYPPAKHDDHH